MLLTCTSRASREPGAGRRSRGDPKCSLPETSPEHGRRGGYSCEGRGERTVSMWVSRISSSNCVAVGAVCLQNSSRYALRCCAIRSIAAFTCHEGEQGGEQCEQCHRHSRGTHTRWCILGAPDVSVLATGSSTCFTRFGQAGSRERLSLSRAPSLPSLPWVRHARRIFHPAVYAATRLQATLSPPGSG
jgi:hypothetical protein